MDRWARLPFPSQIAASLTDDSDDRFDCGYRRWLWSDSGFPSCLSPGASEVHHHHYDELHCSLWGEYLHGTRSQQQGLKYWCETQRCYRTEIGWVIWRTSQMNIRIFFAIMHWWSSGSLLKNYTLVFETSVPVGLNQMLRNTQGCVCNGYNPFYDHFKLLLLVSVGGSRGSRVFAKCLRSNQLDECWLTLWKCPSCDVTSGIHLLPSCLEHFKLELLWSNCIPESRSNCDSIHYLLRMTILHYQKRWSRTFKLKKEEVS